ncbi:MAG: hypothetical protein M9894_37525 [Planctomycetes bacterium]|nr:hypothetical protein [Planctomycetota bacterium]
MPFPRETARQLPWALLLLGTLAAVVPLASGDWDPPWLRVAQRPVSQVGPETSLEVPDVPARFAARGPVGTGGTWTLTGERVVPVDPPLAHDLVAPRLVLRRGEQVMAELSAARGQVRLPGRSGEAGEGPVVRIVLVDDVRLVQGDMTAVTDELTVWLHRERFDPATGGVRASAPGPVTLRLGAAGQELTAAGLQATLVPLDLDLRGPVALRALERPADAAPARGRPEDAARRGPLTRALEGHARAARLRGALTPGPRAGAPDAAGAIPARLTLELDDVDLRAAAPHDDALRCDTLRLALIRAPAGARAGLGGLAGLAPAPHLHTAGSAFMLEEVAARGRVRARVRQGDGPALHVEADALVERPGARRVEATGQPARVEDPARGWVEAPTLHLTRESVDGGAAVRIEAGGGEVRFSVTEPARGATPAAAAWTGRARRLEARLLPAGGEGAGPEPDDARPPSALTRLDLLVLEGAPGDEVVLERDGGGGRIDAQALRWEGGWLQVEGAPATARLGPALTGDAPWRASARRLRARLDPSALAGGEDDDPLARAVAAVSALEAEGQVEVAREDAASPRRALALAGERLSWSRRRARLDLAGPPASVEVGQTTLRAPALSYDLATGALRGRRPLRPRRAARARRGRRHRPRGARHGAAGPPSGGLGRGDARAPRRAAGRGRARPAVDAPGADARGRRRRAGARGGRGRPRRRRRPRHLGRGARPRPAGGAGRGAALPGRHRRGGPRGRARGGLALVRAGARARARRGLVPGRRAGAPPRARARRRRAVRAHERWVAVEVWEPARAERAGRDAAAGRPPRLADRPLADHAPAPFGLLLAGGAGGVAVDGALGGSSGADGGAAAPLRMRAARLVGDGAAETLRLEGAPGRPILLARGDLALEAPRARLALLRAREAVRVELDEPWRCALPSSGEAAPGHAAGRGPLAALVDVGAGRQPGGPPKDPAALLRSLLELDGRGGVEVVTSAVRARADAVSLGGRPGELVLRGDPVEVSRGALRSRGLEQVLRVDELR